MERETKIEGRQVDLTVPINKKDYPMDDEDCLGNMWDMSSKECPQCADRDICAILFKDKLDATAKEMERTMGTKFLDEADFAKISSRHLLPRIESGTTTAAELIGIAAELSNCDDIPSVKQKVIEWVKSEDSVKISGGVVWVQ